MPSLPSHSPSDVATSEHATAEKEEPATAGLQSNNDPKLRAASPAPAAVHLPPGLDSGDIVLFNRRCMSMPPAGAALCVVAKFMSNSDWDHIGIVVRDPSNADNLLFLEADFGGVKLRSLADRVAYSKSNEIAVRRLSVVRTDAMREQLFSFATRMLGRPYEIGTGSVVARVADPAAKAERERLHALLVDKRAAVREIDRELESAALTGTGRRLLSVERGRVSKLADQIERRLIEELNTSNVSDNPQKDLSRVFCSELVAAAYQEAGLLDSYPLANGYNPKDFSSEQKNPPGVHLLKGARLSNEIYLRRIDAAAKTATPFAGILQPAKRRRGRAAGESQKESLPDSRQSGTGGGGNLSVAEDTIRVHGVADGDTPARISRRLIRDVLRRTPLYEKIPDEYKWSHLTKSFTARIIESGDVVFAQGDYDDKIYVIESGAVERFVKKQVDPDPVLVSKLGPRNSFGLTGFTFNAPRSATVRAVERTLLWTVDRPTFERFKDTSVPVQSILSEAEQRTLRGLLKEHFLFRRFDSVGSGEVGAFFPVKFRAGEEIFRQGDSGDNFYIIKSGEVERLIRHPRSTVDGPEMTERAPAEEDTMSLAKTLRAGQSFGELSLMYNAPRGATVRARVDTECWAISAESFHRLNLGHGTQYLRAIFERFASMTKDGDPYMTPSDLLRFADVAAFKDEFCRRRLSSLLIALVTSNRERDPVKSKRSNSSPSSTSSGTDSEEILMDFWEFVRFDIVLNQPGSELDFAFRLADQNNSGFITLDEMLYLLQDYADIDPVAKDMLAGKNKLLHKVFGRDGSRVLTAKEFSRISKDLLPPTFRADLEHLISHMLNMDPTANSNIMNGRDLEELAFIEPDGSPSVLGSQFVGSTRTRGSKFNSWMSEEGMREKSDVARTDAEIPSTFYGMPLGHLLSVGVSGMASRTFVAPLERLKILMQTQPGAGQSAGGAKVPRYNGVLSGLRLMLREESTTLRALFRGNGANVLRIVPNAAIQLAVVDWLHRQRDCTDHNSEVLGFVKQSKSVDAVAIGGVAGMTAAVATYPLDYIRGRLTVQRMGFEPYRGTLDGLRQSIGSEGLSSIYRGLGPTLLGVFPYVGLSFAMYETLRPALPRLNDGSGQPTPASAILAGAMASATGQVAAYPLDTVRRRMQVAGFMQGCELPAGRSGVMAALRDIAEREGVRGLFRGIAPNLVKVAPASAVSFFVYEATRNGWDVLQLVRAHDARSKSGRG